MICAHCETETVETVCTGCGDNALLNGQYQLQRILGRGAQGTTFLATGPSGTVAIKELHLGRASGGKATELFHREAAVLSQLSHDRIPTLYEHFVSGAGVARSLYVVQQFISGSNLEERLKTHRFTESEVQGIVGQVSDILDYLHTLSPPVIHRDIKPSNLVLDDDGQVHLIDFGAVRDVMRDTVGGGSTVAGTFGYMAPEQLVGDATPRSDVYALGMTAIRLLTREHPTTLADRRGVVDWRSRATVSAEFGDWIDAMVQHDPMNRPQVARPLAPDGHARSGTVHHDAWPTDTPPTGEITATTELHADLLGRAIHVLVASRRTRSTLMIDRALDATDHRALEALVAEHLELTVVPRFSPVATRAHGQPTHRLVAKQPTTMGLPPTGMTLRIQRQPEQGNTRLRVEHHHREGWEVMGWLLVLTIAVPLVFGIPTIGLLGGEIGTVGAEEGAALLLFGGLLGLWLAVCSFSIVPAWVYANILASRSQQQSLTLIDSLVRALGGTPADTTQGLPMEERRPHPTARDMAAPPQQTRN